MMRGSLVTMALAGLLLAGCGVKSVDPWLDEATVVTDDRLAGVWQGDCGVTGSEPPGTGDLVIAAVYRNVDDPVEELPVDAEGADAADEAAAAPQPVVYQVVYYAGDTLQQKDQDKTSPPGIRPARYFATLHEIDGTLLLQLCGQVEEGIRWQLVRTLYMLFKADYTDAEIRLYPISTEEGETARMLLESGLQLRYEGEGNYLVISPTEELEAYVRSRLDDPLFFDDQPSIVLRRISDLRAPSGEPAPEPPPE